MIQIGSNKFVPKFLKIDHNFELARSILMKIVASGVKGITNEWVAAPCLGKFVVEIIRRLKVRPGGQNFWSRFMQFQYFLILAALPGAERREGAQPPRVIAHGL